MCQIHTADNYSAIERNKLVIHKHAGRRKPEQKSIAFISQFPNKFLDNASYYMVTECSLILLPEMKRREEIQRATREFWEYNFCAHLLDYGVGFMGV